MQTVTSLPPLPASADELGAISTARWQAVLSAEPQAAAAWLEVAANLGHAEAQAVMGQWRLDGHGVERDPQQALQWFLRAAQLGHAMAANMAGRCHEQGWGTPPDFDKAAHWYRQALKLGDLPEARYNLANLTAAGQGVPRDHVQAHALYRAAAAQGYAKAWAKLGRYHEDGVVVPRDEAAAFDCYRRGAEGGDFRGQFGYAGLLAARGRTDEALAWLEQVLQRATPRYLRQAGELLLRAPDARVRAVGERMLARAGT